MKVYRIKHKPSGLYVAGYKRHKYGKIYKAKGVYYNRYKDDPDYEILYDEIKD